MPVFFRSLSTALLTSTLFHLASAATSGGTTATNDNDYCTLPEPGLPFCSIQGQTDFYGLGVRMGIYFAWLTSWLANNFLAAEISGSLDTNAVFLLAIFVTVMFNSIWRQLRMIDALVLLQLCYGFLFGVMSLWGYRTMYYHRMGAKGRSRFGGFGTHLRLFLMTAISGYAVWFWFEGLDDGLIECNRREACGGLQTFFFVRVRLDGWIRTFYKVGAIAVVAYYGIMCIVAIAALSLRCLRFIKNGRTGVHSEDEDKDEAFEDTGLNQRELSYAYVLLATFNLFWMIFAAVTVEMTLNYNHLTDVLGETGLSTPGQQLPLLIGLFSFVRILWILFKEYGLERRKTTPATRGLGVATGADTTPRGPAQQEQHHRHGHHGHLKGIPLLAAHADRARLQRILVAWLPWLTDFQEFRSPGTSPAGYRFEPVGAGPAEGTPTPALEMRENSSGAAYERKGLNVDVESFK